MTTDLSADLKKPVLLRFSECKLTTGFTALKNLSQPQSFVTFVIVGTKITSNLLSPCINTVVEGLNMEIIVSEVI